MKITANEGHNILGHKYLADILSTSDKWWVAHTKSRQEKALAHVLSMADVSHYLPLVQKRQPNKRRIRFSEVPLFPGYLFFTGNYTDRYLALKSNHVAKVLDVDNPAKLFYELRQIQKAIETNVLYTPYRFIEKGKKAKIISGIFEGIEGIIVKKKSNYRIVLNIEMIHQAIAVEVDVAHVEVVR